MGEIDDTRVFSDRERALSKGEILPGTRAGEYVVQKFIAKGGCASVYAATRGDSSQRVAIKVLHGELAVSPKMVERFVREVEVLNLLRHPNIVEIYDIGRLADGRPYFAMEYLDGVSLEAFILRKERLSPEEALEVLEPVCAALEAAHHAGVIHRDVKASNILVTRGEPRVIKLLDFGIAKLLTSDMKPGLTSVGMQPGTPTIMAPEQLVGEPIDARVDVYALGVLLHRMLTGKLPFECTNQDELILQHLEEPAPRPSDRAPLALPVDSVVLRCLEKWPERRFASVRSVLLAMRHAVGKSPEIREPLRDVEAVGIYLELCMDPDEDLDDRLADDIGRILDLAEDKLRRGGFLLASVTGDQILAVHPLPKDTGASNRKRKAALELATSLYAEVSHRQAPDDRVHANLSVHVDRAAVVRTAAGPEIVAGPLLRTSAWAVRGEIPRPCATREAVRGLSRFDVATGRGPVVILDRPALNPRASRVS
jgi:serine/threonine-protein kinase